MDTIDIINIIKSRIKSRIYVYNSTLSLLKMGNKKSDNTDIDTTIKIINELDGIIAFIDGIVKEDFE